MLGKNMTVCYKSQQGWIISHLEHLNKVYQNVEYKNQLHSFKFNQTLFQINSTYIRKNALQNTNKKKRKKNPLYSEEIDHVKQTLEKILSSSDVVLENGMPNDYNESARLESEKFYKTLTCEVEKFHGSNETPIVSRIGTEEFLFPERCKFYAHDVKDISEKLGFDILYDFILLDPPWWNKSIRRKLKHGQPSYKMMYNESLTTIPIEKLLKSNGIVGIWCTNSPSHLNSIRDEIFPSWGLQFKAKWSWVKVTRDGQPICDFNEPQGKQPFELFILGTRFANDINIPDKKLIISVPSAFHSHKPPVQELLEEYLPEDPQLLELFARYLIPGWTSYGLEVLKFQHLSLFTMNN